MLRRVITWAHPPCPNSLPLPAVQSPPSWRGWCAPHQHLHPNHALAYHAECLPYSYPPVKKKNLSWEVLRDDLKSLYRWRERPREQRTWSESHCTTRWWSSTSPTHTDVHVLCRPALSALKSISVLTRSCTMWWSHKVPGSYKCIYLLIRESCFPPRVGLCQSTVLLTCLLKLCKTWQKMTHQFDLLFLQNTDCDLETVVPKTSESLKK